MRRLLGLRPDQRLILLLFDKDKILERLFDPAVVLSIAEAGYDAVVSPSYSAWSPRPRTETMFNAKRSLVYLAALQAAGVHGVPRVVWEVEQDVRRYASWVEANRCIEIVALDLQTYRVNRDFAHQLDGLARFDSLTGARLSYVVNGPTTAGRIRALFDVLSGQRLHLTNATAHLGLRACRGEPGLGRVKDRTVRFALQASMAEALIAAAATREKREAA